MRILLASGSSGGHIFPALALMRSLKEQGALVRLVLPLKSKENFCASDPELEYIHSANFGIGLSGKNIAGVFSFLRGAWESLLIILRFHPDVVVGFGSLPTVALLFWAWLFRARTIIHEQNVICGRANRFLIRLVDKVAVSFRQTEKYLPVSASKILFTGNPLRKELIRLDKKAALDFFKFQEGRFNLLIVGGSQGAHKLNTVSQAALAALDVKQDIQVIHIAGSRDLPVLKESYSVSGVTYKLFDFFPDMQYAYSLADLVICRAGATTIAELQRFQLPALLVPYPFAYAHQQENARVLEEIGAAEIISDADLSVESLRDKLAGYLRDPQKLAVMRQGYAQLPVLDSVNLLTKEVLTLS